MSRKTAQINSFFEGSDQIILQNNAVSFTIKLSTGQANRSYLEELLCHCSIVVPLLLMTCKQWVVECIVAVIVFIFMKL